MKFSLKQSKVIASALALTLVFQLASCGTLLYPERRGQEGGKIDPVVAVMDGVGLLFFLIPGIIAFGVDIGTGAIYLPPGGRSEAPPAEGEEESEEPFRVVYVDPATLSTELIETAIARETGLQIRLTEAEVDVRRYDSVRTLTQEVAAANAGLRPVEHTARAGH